MAMALAVPSRLWLGGVISPRRDRALSTELVQKVRAGGGNLAILVCVDVLASYVTAFLRVFRHKVATGCSGRHRQVFEPTSMNGPVLLLSTRHAVVTDS